MSKFNKIAKGSAAFDAAVKVFNESVDRFDYDGMAEAYNETAVGDYLSFEYKKGKGAVVAQQLEKRGLKRGDDFDVRSASNEGTDTATVLVLRISDKTAGPAQHAQRGRKPATPAAGTEGAAAPAAAAPAKPAKGK
jgi:hypothetical protein